MISNITNRVLIIRFSSLGDVLLTTPLIRSIKNRFPNLKIDFLVRDEYLDLLKLNPYLNKIYIIKRDQEFDINILIKNNYDIAIDLQNNYRSSKLLRKIKAKKLKYKKNNLLKFLLVNFKINFLKETKTVPERYASVIPNFTLDNQGLDLFLPENIKSSLDKNKKFIAFAPGSRHFTKMWKEEYFIKLGNMIQKENYTVVLLGGESDKEICENISDGIESSINLSNDNNLFQLCADLKMCSALVCNDSGLMHVGAALQIPLVTIFGSTVKEFGFTPYNCKSIIIENNDLSCRPCSHIGRNSCPKKHFLCMETITPDLVFNNLINLLK